jgi:hypothetical protein
VAGMARHNIGNDYYDRIRAAGLASGFASVGFETNNSYVTSYIITGRVLYKF